MNQIVTRALQSAVCMVALTSFAQSPPQLPGKIAPGPKDTNYFICSVSPINNDDTARNLYGKTKNLWTEAVKGGKFELVNPQAVRVMAPTADDARNDIYAFYQKYAAAVYVRSPLYDSKGNKSIGYVVSKCEPDSSRATNLNIANVSKDKYIKLETDVDHFFNALKQLKTPIDDERLVIMYDNSNLPTDVFDRKELMAKRLVKVKDLIQKTNDNKFIKLSGSVKLEPFSFETNSFSLKGLQNAVESYGYSFKPQFQGQSGSFLSMPAYDVTVPASMMAFKPASTEEAKMIERERTSGELSLVSYIQVSNTEFVRPPMTVKGVLTQIDVLNKKGTVLFSLSAK